MKKIITPLVCIAITLISFLSTAQSAFIKRESILIAGEGAIYGEDNMYGPGISFYDFDNDGWDDITLPASVDNDFQFFKNTGGEYESIDLPISSNGVSAKQVIWVDFDNDNDVDFFSVGVTGGIWLYRNDGNSNYTNITTNAGFNSVAEQGLWGSSWGDYDNDGYLDVFLSMMSNEFPSRLFHNNGDGTFTDVTIEANLELDPYNTFCASWFDYDGDNDLDIYLANNFCPWENILYKNNGDGSFTNVSSEANVDLEMLAMSTTIDDYNEDGYLDIFVTNWNGTCEANNTVPGSAFLLNNGDGTFSEVAEEKGVSFQGISWGAVFLDANNDGNKDLLVASIGTVSNDSQITTYYEQNDDGNFVIPNNTGLENDQEWSYGNAIGDIDNDGRPDAVVINTLSDPIYLLENNSSDSNSWLKVKLKGTESNAMGIGATIKVIANGQTHYNYTLCGEGYISQNSSTEFFGLGDATTIDIVEIYWPSGTIDHIEDVDVNQSILIEEGENPLSVEETSESQVRLFPNPIKDYVTINGNLDFIGGELELYDNLGRLLQKEKINTVVTELNMTVYDAGLYFIKLKKGERQSIKKVLKN